MPAAPRTDRAFVGVQRVGAALARGWSPYELRGPLWLVPHRGLRVVAGVDPRDAGLRIAVAAALLPPGGALAGWAAVHVHRRGQTLVDGLDLAGRPLPIELVVPVGHRIRRRSTDFPLRVREVRLDPGDVVTIDGVPVTSLARTAFDIARHADLVEAVVLLDALFAPAPPGWRMPVER